MGTFLLTEALHKLWMVQSRQVTVNRQKASLEKAWKEIVWGDEMNSVATDPDFLTLSPKHSWLH